MTAETRLPCHSCGAPVSPGIRFCSNCGADVSGVQSSVATAMLSSIDPAAPLRGEMVSWLREATLGEYEILAKLGEGGMAEVYLAHDIALDRKVAIKVMLPALLRGEGMVERFKREARTAASLSHPHIIPIYAVRERGNLLYFVMKYVEGRPLDSIIHEVGPLPARMVQTILSQVGPALGQAHRKGIVHRDIKPSNIMVDTDGYAVVTDFGIAKASQGDQLTMTGATVGTPGYMSPEQCKGGEVTGLSDQYSLGVVAYEMLTGHPPFDAPSVMGLMWAQVHDAPKPLGEVCPSCPPELASAVTRMLEKDPAHRWPTVNDAADAIGSVPTGRDDSIRTQLIALAASRSVPVIIRPTPTSPVPPRRATVGSAETVVTHTPVPVRRRSWWIVGAALLGVAAAGAWLVLKKPPVPSPTAPPRVAQVSLTPAAATLSVGDSALLAVSVLDSSRAPLSGQPVTWTATLPGVATVDQSGWIRALTPGDAMVIATAADRSDTTAVRVTARPLRAIAVELTPRDTTLTAQTALRLADKVTGEAGVMLAGRDLRWRSSSPPVATVDSVTGVITARQPGQASISARTSDGITGSARIRVVAAPAAVARIQLASPGESATVGDTLAFRADALDARGAPVPDRSVAWSSDNSSVAAVDAQGRVVALKPGIARITATADTVRASSLLSIRASAAVAAPVTQPARDAAPPPAAAPAVPAMVMAELSAGGNASCAVVEGGVASCWGGDPPSGARFGEVTFQKLSVGDGFACGITAAGEAYCWGGNAQGQLGDGSTTDRPSPTAVAGRQSFEDISAGTSHACGLTRDGAAYCWGGNRSGQLGDGSKSNRTRPVKAIGSHTFQSVAAGALHSCGITRENKAFCWGDGLSNQLGNGKTGTMLEPDAVNGTLSFRTVAVGARHSCGLTTLGRIYCWGENKTGQLGNDTRDDRNQPDSVYTDQLFRTVVGGGSHTCGLTTNGQVLCWGDNSLGQLGDGSRRSRQVPGPILSPGNLTYQKVSAGAAHTCALTTTGLVLCWGANGKGQLGTQAPSPMVPTPGAIQVTPKRGG